MTTGQLSLDQVPELSDPVRATDPATSADAAASVRESAANDRALVLEVLAAHGGSGTADQITDWLQQADTTGRVWMRNCVSSRCSQLCDPERYAGQPPLRDSGERGTGRTGRPVIVFELTGGAR